MNNPRGARNATILVVLTGIVTMIRYAVIFTVRNITTVGSTDQYSYVSYAESLASGNHYKFFSVPPLYPLFLAVVMQLQQKLPLPFLHHLPIRLTAGVLQTQLAAVAILSFSLMVSRRVSAMAGFVTVVAVGLFPFNQVLAPGTLMTERFSTPLFLLGFSWLMWQERPSKRHLLISGASFGLMALTRPALIPVVAVSVVAVVVLFKPDGRKAALRGLAVFGLPLVVLIGGWTSYVYVQSGELAPIGASGGFNFCMGNAPSSIGGWSTTAIRECGGVISSESGEAIRDDRREMRVGLTWAKHHLNDEPRLVKLRWRFIFNGDADSVQWYPGGPSSYQGPFTAQGLMTLFNASWSWLKLVSVSGLIYGVLNRSLRRLTLWALWFGAAQVVIPLISVGDSRYHDALIPLMVLWSVAMITSVIMAFFPTREAVDQKAPSEPFIEEVQIPLGVS